ncbi:efflux RND transporter periplasmic adaptor subunit [Dysgonomonas sp. 521]|uniref:efflux RND transporter periplasmic adaptor subunit n=1 Tax=Dysgonomonas sp. 521 TaxID=2302932 RepID=UPI0013D3DC7F|nr:efflux RND transporter periplasmic adaptor subunit [Dysgonomonas sp. 521]NDV96151.1 efflux RND transporter periplasmic adaptor subunit [Dysgonomonas sp. 521]
MKAIYISLISLSLILLVSCGQNTKSESTENSAENTEQAHEGESEEIAVSEAQMNAVGIKLGKIEQRELNSVIRVNGEMDLDPQKKAEVTSLVGGIIKQVLVIEGKRVSAGQAVAYLENTEIVELQKNYLTLRKEALTAEQEYNRQKELSSQGAGVEKTFQQATAAYEIAKAQLTGLEKQLRQLSISPEQVSAGNMVTQIPIKSPISGTVRKINISTGSYADTQISLMSISDNSAVHCDMKIFEKDINAVKIGQEVDILLTNQPGVNLKGEIYEINKSFEGDTKAILVHIRIKNQGNIELIPGMYATGLINVGKQKTPAVPNDAVISSEGKKYIFVLEDEENGQEGKSSHFKREEVITGISELGFTQITPVNQLKEDVTIVTANAFYIASMASDHGEHGH